MAASSVPRPPRKDSRQNRAHILDVASEAFAREGVEVSMDAVARLAGIGSATLYRHFPNKEALLAELLAPYHEALERKRRAIEVESGDAGRKLEHWIEALGEWMTAYDGLPEPLRSAWSATGSPLRPTCDALIEMTDSFLRPAQREGAARNTVSASDIFLGALAVAWASGRTTAQRDIRDIFRNGWAAGER